MEADRKAVAALSAAAREKLRPWAELNPETDAKKIVQMAISKLGDLEGIPLLIKTMRLDADLSGEICEEEWSNYLETGQRMVDGTVNLAVNCGVVGALILSILIPYSIERAELS